MTPHQMKLKSLIDTLSARTSEGLIQWRLGTAGKSVLTTLKNGTVEVKQDFDSEGQDAVRVNIFDDSGNVVSSFDDTDLSYLDDFTNQRAYYYVEMKDLLDGAARSARGEDVIINSILEELNKSEDDGSQN